MGKRFKIFVIIFLSIIILGVGGFIYYNNVAGGSGGLPESRQALNDAYQNHKNYLDGFYSEYEYIHSYQTTLGIVSQKTKCYVAYDGDTKKRFVIEYDTDGSISNFTYKEYKVLGTSITCKDYILFTPGSTNFIESSLTEDEYKLECKLDPEFITYEALQSISSGERAKADVSQNGGSATLDVNLKKNAIKKTTSIVIDLYTSLSSGGITQTINDEITIVLKDKRVISNTKKFDITLTGEGTDSYTKSTTYSYTKGSFNPDTIYNEYIENITNN